MWMQRALREAEKALAHEEIPVGAVVVLNDEVIGRGYNQTESLNDPTAHAEMIAISAAANTLQSWRLDSCSIYVTLEPCAMCAGAIVLARFQKVIIGAMDPKAGACGSLRNIVQDHRLNHQVELLSGVLEEESSDILKRFFQRIRIRKSGKTE
ncbi:nucleoside deaminase [bacterium]|nr:nucleoside deaminase [bacterium]RQV92232.1 MAG: nucleoside deaminase [bacterium]